MFLRRRLPSGPASVAVQIYAKCIAGQEVTARKRIEQALTEE